MAVMQLPTAYLAYSGRFVRIGGGRKVALDRTYKVRGVTEEIAASDQIYRCPGLPDLLDEEHNSTVIVTSFDARPLNPQTVWEVKVSLAENPLALAPEVNFYASQVEVPAIKYYPEASDEFQLTIRNAAGDLYNPPSTVEKSVTRMEVVRRCRIEDYNPFRYIEYLHRINSTDWPVRFVSGNGDQVDYGTLRPGTARFVDVRSSTVRDPFYHLQETAVFLIDGDGWDLMLPQIGPRVKNVNTGLLEPPRTAAGAFFNGLALLDANGYQLQDGNDPIYQSVRVRGKADFTLLKLLDQPDLWEDGWSLETT